MINNSFSPIEQRDEETWPNQQNDKDKYTRTYKHNFEIGIMTLMKVADREWYWTVGRGLKTKSWNIKTRIAELGVFIHKFAIENDPKP